MSKRIAVSAFAVIFTPLLVLAADMPAGLKAAFENARYAVESDAAGAHHADNAANHFAVRFVGEKTVIDTGKGATTLRLAEYGWGSELRPVGPVEHVESAGKRLTRQYGSEISEWFENRPQGLEQGFVLTQRAQAAKGSLRIHLAANGGWKVQAAGEGLRLTRDNARINYAGLKAWDAKGTALTSRLRATSSNGIEIEVDDARATYPLTVDPEFTGSDSVAGDLFGYSVALSSDGNTALLGAWNKNSVQGAAYVFARTASGWTQQQKLTASDAANSDYFGWSVALSGDGSTALVGAYGKNGSLGAAYVFAHTASGWTQQQKLTASDAASYDDFGWSVALSSDGNTALVGTQNKGAAYVFARTAGSWTQQQELTAPDGINLGWSVAVSGDGSTAMVGAIGNNSYAGAAYVFTHAASGWVQQQELTASDAAANADYFGGSVALSSDGSTALVGAPLKNGLQGAAYVFARAAGSWTQQQKLTALDAAYTGYFGQSVALSSDGSTAQVGAYGENDYQGAAYVFRRASPNWTQEKLTSPDGAANDQFGYSVALSGDGKTALVGAYGKNSKQGAAYVLTPETPRPDVLRFPSTPVGTASAPLTISFTFPDAETLAAKPYVVLTQGAQNLDFKAAATQPSNACVAGHSYNAGDICAVNVIFTPTKPFQRLGALQLMASGSTPLATFNLVGPGVGPLVNFSSSNQPLIKVGSSFNYPGGVAVDGSGNVFVTDGGLKEILASNGTVSSSSTVINVGGGFSALTGVAVDGSGNVFVSDLQSNAVYEIVAVNGSVSAASTVITVGSGFTNATALAVDASGNVFVADSYNRVVKEIVAFNGQVSSNSPIITVGSGFFRPAGVAVDGNGNVFVADGGITEIVAVNGQVSASSAVTAVGSGINNAEGVSVDGNGNVFVSDDGYIQEILAVNGQVSSSSTVITLSNGPSYYLGGVALDSNGNIFLANPSNNAVDKLDRFDPPSLTFPSTDTGSQSAAQSLTIQNSGNAPLNSTAISVSTNFLKVAGSGTPADCAASTTLAPNASCNISIAFAPTVSGLSVTGGVTLSNNNLNGNPATQVIPLNGDGVQTTPTSMLGAPSPSAAIRNNFSGFVGMKFTVGSTPITVLSLGRVYLANNSQTHVVKLVDASSGLDLPNASVSLTMTPGTANTYQYAPLAKAVTLQPNASYYLVTQEFAGGDKWYDIAPVAAGTAFAVNGAAYQASTASYILQSTGSVSYGPPNMQFAGVALPAVSITSPANGATVSGTIQLTATATPTSGLTITSVQFLLNGSNFGGPLTTAPYTLPLDTSTLLTALNTVTAVATDSNGGTSTATSVSFTVAANSFLTSTPSGTLRNDFAGYVGFKFTVGAKSLAVSQLGRWVVSGNNGTHIVKLVTAGGTDLPNASVSLSLAGATAGKYAYASLTSPVILAANTTYYLVTQEFQGGDRWYDAGLVTPNAGAGTVNSAVYQSGTGPYITIFNGSYSYVTPNFVFVPVADVPFLTSIPSTVAASLRNDFTGYVGMEFTVSNTPLVISQLGRWKVAGNSAAHIVKLVQIDGTDLAGGAVSVNMAGATAGQYAYAPLASPITLLANTSYYLVTQEVAGGDQWFNSGPVTASSGTVNYSVYQSAPGGYNIDYPIYPSTSYGPPNFLYSPGKSSTPPPPASPLITSAPNSSLRNDYSGFVGMKFTVGSAPINVSQLGRWGVTGNSSTHIVKLVDGLTGADIASVTVKPTTPGQFNYSALASQVTLAANQAYYLVTQETAGGDQWYDAGPVTANSAVTVNNPAYQSSTGAYILEFNGSGSYGTVSLSFNF